ncbi:MAG TPA: hypothetical protein PK639_01500 [Candidatus Woesebacteria bacterium]|nr:hypothetical protein [Candidatus Woesebacteria bacterium]
MTQTNDTKAQMLDFLNKIEVKCEEIFVGKLPAMPQNIKEIIVKIAPYLTIVGLLFSTLALLTVFGTGFALLSVTALDHTGGTYKFILNGIFIVVFAVLQIMALPGMFKLTAKSWKLLFYISLLSIVSNLLAFNLGGVVIGGGISLYILFQVKSLYKN